MKLESSFNKWHLSPILLVFSVIGILYIVSSVAILAWPNWWMSFFAVTAADRHQWSALLLGETAKIVFALSAGVTIYMAFQRMYHSRESLDLTRKSQLDSRMADSIELLGSTGGKGARVEARLGAVMLLETVVNTDGTYAPLVRDLLLEYIRAQGREGFMQPVDTMDGRADMAAAFRVLFRLAKEAPGMRIVLENLNLRGLRLGEDWLDSDLNLPTLQLSHVELHKAHLSKLKLTNDTRLNNVTFHEARIEKVTWPSQINSCSFKSAYMQQSVFAGTTISGGDFANTELQATKWSHVQIVGNVEMTASNFSTAELKAVNFGAALIYSTVWVGSDIDDECEWRQVSANKKTLDNLTLAKRRGRTSEIPRPPDQDNEQTPPASLSGALHPPAPSVGT